MRFYDIALFILLFNIVLGGLTELGIADYTAENIEQLEGFSGDDQFQEGIEQINETVGNAQEGIFAELNWLVENVRLVINGIAILITAFANATIFLPGMLVTLKVPGAIAGIIVGGVWITYFVGLLQFILGRSFKEAE